MRPLVLVGGGGHCKSVIEAAESAGMTIKGILDFPEYVGTTILGYPIIGTDDDMFDYVPNSDFIVTLGYIKDCRVRNRLICNILNRGGQMATVIASTARISHYAELGAGTVVLHQANVNAGARIGKNCIVNSCANIEHDVWVGDGCHISTGAMVNGDCTIGTNTFIGSQSVIANGVSIPDDCIIGAGAVVCKSIHQKGLYIGCPARLIE